jgi:hypothetical protein
MKTVPVVMHAARLLVFCSAGLARNERSPGLGGSHREG